MSVADLHIGIYKVTLTVSNGVYTDTDTLLFGVPAGGGVALQQVQTSSNTSEPIRPLAQYNISTAGELLIEVQNLLSQAQTQGLDTSLAEDTIKNAEECLVMAQKYFAGGNYIAANIQALRAIEAFDKAIGILKDLLHAKHLFNLNSQN